MSEGFPAQWLGEQLVARLNLVLAPLGFQSGVGLVWEGTPQETMSMATWQCQDDDLTVRYEFWGGLLRLSLKEGGTERWTTEAVVHHNEAVRQASNLIEERLLLHSSLGHRPG